MPLCTYNWPSSLLCGHPQFLFSLNLYFTLAETHECKIHGTFAFMGNLGYKLNTKWKTVNSAKTISLKKSLQELRN
jgi:hypothetical protein